MRLGRDTVAGQRSGHSGAVLTHALQPDVVVVEARAAVAGVGGEQVGTLSVFADFRPEHLALVRV